MLGLEAGVSFELWTGLELRFNENAKLKCLRLKSICNITLYVWIMLVACAVLNHDSFAFELYLVKVESLSPSLSCNFSFRFK